MTSPTTRPCTLPLPRGRRPALGSPADAAVRVAPAPRLDPWPDPLPPAPAAPQAGVDPRECRFRAYDPTMGRWTPEFPADPTGGAE